MRLFWINIFLFFAIPHFSQDVKQFDYRFADSIALNFPKKKYKNITEIAGPLTEKLNTEHEKFRAIFRWITDNIEYNKAAGNVADADKIVRKNKAVCQGFSNLLKEMCDLVRIECEVITGYTKTEVRDINKKLDKTDHAWNSVKLNGQWYLCDVTWATSKYNVITRRFMKEFDEHYYLTPADKFILDHFPKEKRHQYLPKPIKAKAFVKTPVFYPDYFHLKMDKIQPEKGKFKIKQGKPLCVSFLSREKPQTVGVLINSDKYITPVEWKTGTNPDEYFFEFNFTNSGITDFTLYVNNLCVAEYLINVK